jgi:hypothetical protein
MALNVRSGERSHRDFDIRFASGKGTIGDVLEVSFAPAENQEGVDDGFELYGISIKIKEINPKTNASIGDVFQLSITGKPGSYYAGKGDSFQNVKLLLKEGQETPLLEEGKSYLFTGVKIKAEEVQEQEKIASSFGGRMPQPRR